MSTALRSPFAFTRRAVLLGASAVLTGCATNQWTASSTLDQPTRASGFSESYKEIVDGSYTIPALDMSEIDPQLLRQEVIYRDPYKPGALIVKTHEHRLYLVLPGGRALRYGVGVGREEALNFRGTAMIGRKAEWPSWTPTAAMVRRLPKYAAYLGGMPGGPENPLGARALYLFKGSQDTHFRLHGTNEPASIGTDVSSGCIRLFNHDIIDLYRRVPLGTSVTVLHD